MRRIIGVLACMLFVGAISAQSINQSNVPAVVLNAFHLQFPNADDVKWKLEKGNYRVTYKVNSKAHKLTMDDKGKLLRHSQDLYVSELPPAVLATIQSKVTYFDIHDADRYEADGQVRYEINFKIDGKNHLFRISETGELQKFRQELKDSEIPSSIMNLIRDIYGEMDIDGAKYVEEPEQTIYMIRGEINDYDHAFTFVQDGTILKHSQDLAKSEIPESILKTLNKSYDGYEIRDADLEEEGGKGVYILKLRKSRDNVRVTFSPKGRVLEERK
jgi:uncharacterized membrane protein YkoI